MFKPILIYFPPLVYGGQLTIRLQQLSRVHAVCRSSYASSEWCSLVNGGAINDGENDWWLGHNLR